MERRRRWLNGKPWYKPPAAWRGEDVYVIGGGPSLEGKNLASLRSKGRILGINNAYRLNDYRLCDAVWFGDLKWWMQHRVELHKMYGGLLATCLPHDHWGKWPGLRVMGRFREMSGICKKPGWVSWNSNSGASGINFAWHLMGGEGRVILLGFDLQRDPVTNRNNWHRDHIEENKPDHNPYDRFRTYFKHLAKSAKDIGFTILNGTPGSALDVFPFIEVEEMKG